MLKVELKRDELNVDSSSLILADIVEKVLANTAPIAPRVPVSVVRERELLVLSG